MSSLIELIKAKRKLTKILIVGSGAVGKTSLVKVLKTNVCLQDMEDKDAYHRTLFLEIDKVNFEESEGVFQVIDVAGQLNLPIHAFRDASSVAFGNVDLILVVFANDNLQSFLEIERWLSLIQDHYHENKIDKPPSFVLVRNKIDKETTAEESLIEQVKRMPIFQDYFEISCMTGEGLDELKTGLCEYC